MGRTQNSTNNHVSAFIAFSWSTDPSKAFFADDAADGMSRLFIYAPFSLHHPLNGSGHNVGVDQSHEFDVAGATATIWHTSDAMFGSISFSTGRHLQQVVHRINNGELRAISPTIDNIEFEYTLSENEQIKTITAAHVKTISLVRASANPNSRIWVQPYDMQQPSLGRYDSTFHLDWAAYSRAFHACPVRTANASIAWRRFAGLY